jgi:hypothetical protein
MKKTLLCVMVCVLAVTLTGCGKKVHPVKVYVDESFSSGGADKIAVFPFSTSITQAADPNRLAPQTFDKLFREELDKRNDYNWVSPGTVQYVLDREELEADAQRFVDEWRQKREANKEFLAKMGQSLQVDGVLIGVVELWQQDEVDPRESAVATTYVGATVTIFDVADGKVLFEASDEDMLEGVRNEDRDSQIIRSGTGQIYADPTGAIYKAPPLDEVAVKVAQALARSIPIR